jgi:pyruvate dehydrogenase E1 component beta subunit
MLEGWFMHVPGLTVVAPSTAEDARGLLISAIRSDDPVIMIEHKDLYKVRMPLSEDAAPIPFGSARILREGDAATVISYSKAVHTVALAAVQLAKEGIHVEVVDVRSLKPLDTATLAASVRKTGRALIVTEAIGTAGPAAELACQVLEGAFDYLEAPIARLTTPETAIPFAPPLEAATIPGVEDVARAVRALVG